MVSRNALLRCCLLGMILTTPAHPQESDLAKPEEYEGKPITEVRFDPLHQPVSQADLARLVPFKPGTSLHLAEVRDAIKELYATGRYSNIEIETQPAPNGVVLLIRTTDQWFVGPVEVQGSIKNPPNAGQLANAARLELGTPYEDADLESAVKGITGLFQRNGLYLAKIDPKVERDAEHQQVSLTFRVKAAKRARFEEPLVKGDTKIPADKVAGEAKYRGWFRWKPATDDNTERGIHNIENKYAKQDRLTASVSLDGMDYHPDKNRVQPTIDAEGGPKVKIQTSGAKMSKGKLKEYVPVWDEGTVNRDLLVSGVRNLRDYYQSEGYFNVAVDFQTKQVSADEQDITYTVELGTRHKVVKVSVQGNRYFKTADIRQRMFIQPAGFLILRHGRYSEGFAKRDEQAIEQIYRDNGFRDCKVMIDTQDNYQGKTGNVAVNVRIAEGPQYKIASLTVEGMTRKDKDTILKLLSSTPGEPFSDTGIATDRDYILDVYQSSGYPDATFESQLTPGPGPDEITVRYIITEGEPRYVRDVLISGMHTARHRLIDPLITLKPGDPLSWTEMGRMQRGLYNLGVFDKVDMAIQNPDGDTENKYVLYHLVEGNRYNMALGFGAEIAQIGGSETSLDSPAGTTGFAPRCDVELSRLDLWGLGHTLTLKARYSTLDERFSLNYLIPRFENVEGRDISVTGLYDNTRDVLTFTARRVEGALQVSNKLSKATRLLLRYTWRDVQVDQSTLKINPLLIPLESTTAHLASIGANLIQDRRDNPADAHRGYYNTADLALVEHYFGGNKNFLRFLARNSYYHKLVGQFILASNTQFGWIHPFSVTPGIDPFEYVPISERFFGGGGLSMRAFPDNQAGPRDTLTGFPIGGNALLFHQTELRFPFIGANIQGVLFHDLGNIYQDLGSISFSFHQPGLTSACLAAQSCPASIFDYTVHAVGFGIRYKTPLGPIRLDLAYSINPPTFDGLVGTYTQLIQGTATQQITNVSHFQFFFSIGQAF
jgi:outer membrane protein insertion porin family